MKHTVSFFKKMLKTINDRLEQDNYVHRLRGQFLMEKGQLKKIAFYYRSVYVFQVLNKQAILTEGLTLRKAEQWLENFDPMLHGFERSNEERFINGFESWNASHFEMVSFLNPLKDGTHSFIRHLCQGREGLYELSREMTDKFESENKGMFWEGGLHNAVKQFCELNKV